MLNFILAGLLFVNLHSPAPGELHPAKVITTVKYAGKQYYADLVVSGYTATLWLRVNKVGTNPGDINALKLVASSPTYKTVKNMACKTRKVYDNGKTIAGCLASATGGFCAVASVLSEGIATPLCVSSWNYAATTGLKDCVNGISGMIAKDLAVNSWAALATKASITPARWNSAIDTSIDYACQ